MFEAPIPGQSLTTPPKQYPWERPPEMVDPEEAMAYYVDWLTNAERMSAIMEALELGFTVKNLTEGIVRVGVAEGLHTIDVGLLVSPVVHHYIKSTAQTLKVDFEEGFEDKATKEKNDKNSRYLKAKLSARKQKEVVEQLQMEEPETVVVEEEEKPKSLMTRRMK